MSKEQLDTVVSMLESMSANIKGGGVVLAEDVDAALSAVKEMQNSNCCKESNGEAASAT